MTASKRRRAKSGGRMAGTAYRLILDDAYDNGLTADKQKATVAPDFWGDAREYE